MPRSSTSTSSKISSNSSRRQYRRRRIDGVGGGEVYSHYRSISQYYTLGKTIGEGTFGKVKQGVHKLTDIKVAIKILEKKRIVDVSDVERISREIHILKHIKHEHVVNLYEVVDTKRFIFLVMEYASGGELFDEIVARGRIAEADAARYFNQILHGVAFCHSAQVIHRDLKPENLLLDSNNNIKIADFGLGNIMPSGAALLTTACGSPCYAAPEMIAGNAYDGIKSDMWSTGIILFALVCGYLPFEDPNTALLYKKIISGKYECPDFVSTHARDLISRILNTNPKRRFGVSQIYTHPWMNTYVPQRAQPPSVGVEHSNTTKSSPVDARITNEMVLLGYDLKHVVESVLMQAHDHFHATYQLLLHRHRAGEAPPDIILNSMKLQSARSMTHRTRQLSLTHRPGFQTHRNHIEQRQIPICPIDRKASLKRNDDDSVDREQQSTLDTSRDVIGETFGRVKVPKLDLTSLCTTKPVYTPRPPSSPSSRKQRQSRPLSARAFGSYSTRNAAATTATRWQTSRTAKNRRLSTPHTSGVSKDRSARTAHTYLDNLWQRRRLTHVKPPHRARLLVNRVMTERRHIALMATERRSSTRTKMHPDSAQSNIRALIGSRKLVMNVAGTSVSNDSGVESQQLIKKEPKHVSSLKSRSRAVYAHERVNGVCTARVRLPTKPFVQRKPWISSNTTANGSETMRRNSTSNANVNTMSFLRRRWR